eukprot:TRINITY_DN5189_c0_g3_i1.p1 TRINITY_DN5189_c0_g3~~TRINITY_DN5189_c0_g3_i1.p1  ORF type:complete len:173 (+),score=15.80 TRINITY_DN5189_c0_g3_i1:125-643(+)
MKNVIRQSSETIKAQKRIAMPTKRMLKKPELCHNLEECEDVFHTCLLGDWTIWFVVSGWIVRSFAHLHTLDSAILDDEYESLASRVAKGVQRTWMVHAHSNCFRELAPCVGKESDDRTLHLLILGPRLHHCAIIHTVNQHLVNSLLLQLSLLGKVARHLHCRSARSECTRQA